MRLAALGLMLLVVGGCKKKHHQTPEEGYRLVCDAVKLSGVSDPHDYLHAMKWVEPQITNDAVHTTLGKVAAEAPGTKGQLIRDAAKAAGVPSCALADAWDADHEANDIARRQQACAAVLEDYVRQAVARDAEVLAAAKKPDRDRLAAQSAKNLEQLHNNFAAACVAVRDVDPDCFGSKHADDACKDAPQKLMDQLVAKAMP